MSWVKNRNKNKPAENIKPDLKAENPPQITKKPEQAAAGNSPKITESPAEPSENDIWEYIKSQIIFFAPAMIPLVCLPVVHTNEKASVLCNGREIYISDEIRKLPADDILYMVIKEFTQVLLGFRVKKNIKTVKLKISEETARKELGMITAKTENMLCDIILLNCPEDIGVSSSLIKPSANLLRRIYKSFGPYTDNNRSCIMYEDDKEALEYFMKEWSNSAITETMKLLTAGYKYLRGTSTQDYIDIHFSISPVTSYYSSRNIEISCTPKGYFLIHIPAEDFEQPAGQGQNKNGGAADKQSDASEEQPQPGSSQNQDSSQPEPGDEHNQDSGQSMTENNMPDLQSGDSAGGNKASKEEKGPEASESMPDKNDAEFASEYLSVINEEQASMSSDTYKEILSESRRFLNESPLSMDLKGFGEMITETYNDLYKISSAWWKKAQSMIMSYVPDVNSSYRRPNKKFAMSEFILPSRCEKAENFEVDRLRVFLDSSGSMTSRDFKVFKSLINTSQKYFPKDTLAYEFNTAVTPMKCVNGKIIGSPAHTGGTDINCVTEFISRQQDKAKTLNIVVTDGYFYWDNLIKYMKQKDKMSKFLFILTTDSRDYYKTAKAVSAKRLKIILIGSDEGGEALSWKC